ncbi:MAG: UDP-N-acetylmuramoyl-tripeptide--D-alanyl-D-alanine ligase [Chitinophagaceae bacterium]|nr:MAG: UDP-N-acetylmuramoyl-tripeptide--D-alanyl-D-alanine ligase [Chitinophagaceae bacterium]
MDINELYKIYCQYPSIQTDTRKLRQGDLFFALKGPNFNGNLYAKTALEQGASFAIIDEKEFELPDKTILVANSLLCLQTLAKHHREQFSIPFIAITGSNGKTTTKELIHAVLSSTFSTYSTEGNLNNQIGVPLSILKIPLTAQIAVIEMGANHEKEIENYCSIALPTHGLITNCGKAHLEGFGSEEGVRKAKGELYTFLKINKGTVFVMRDYDYLQRMSQGISSKFKYGTNDAEIEGATCSNELFLSVQIKKGMAACTISTQLIGDYNLPNVLAAVAVGKHFGVPDENIISAIENYIPSNSRSQFLKIGSNQFIMDAYNANPSSMKAAIENFANIKGNNKVLLLGAMAELGKESEAAHLQLIELINQFSWKEVILVGENFYRLKTNYRAFKNVQEAKTWFQKSKFENTNFLLKGSRSVQMEKIIEA